MFFVYIQHIFDLGGRRATTADGPDPKYKWGELIPSRVKVYEPSRWGLVINIPIDQ